MTLFLIWIGMTSLGVGLYIFFLWKHNHRESGFQVKLTVLFLLFVLIPTVPLTFLVSQMITRSANLLLMPQIGEALETSIETVRTQVEEKGEKFLTTFDDPSVWTSKLLKENELEWIGNYRLAKDTATFIRSIHSSESLLPHEWRPRLEPFREITALTQTSCLGEIEKNPIISIYRKYSDSTAAVAVYVVNPKILLAKEKITRALGIYNTLYLLKESIVQKNLIWALAVLFLVSLVLLSTFAAKRLSRGISGPIRDLVRGMERVSEGDLSARVVTNAKDEFLFMVNSFNNMISDLKTSRQKFIQLERLAAWQEVARQISVDMKNSLMPISTSLRRMRNQLDQKSLSSQFIENWKAIESELMLLENRASDFAEFARIPKLQKSPLNINELVQSVVNLTKATTDHVKIETQLSAAAPIIQADRDRIKQLINALLKNGVEASYRGSTVTISTQSSSNQTLVLEIRDQGEGMDDENLKKVFQPFFTTKKRNTGLGLTIAQKIAEDHGGEILIESKRGNGTLVKVTLKSS